MRRASPARGSLLSVSCLLLAAACGSRTALVPGRTEASAGTGGSDMQPPAPECVTAADCLQPLPEQCGVASCEAAKCVLTISVECDDGNPCTTDSCAGSRCVFADDRVDADDDGAFASGNSADPKAALGCGDDCDDASPNVRPGAVERCDSSDNDCNGIVDDGTALSIGAGSPVRVSPLDAEASTAGGLAFDGQSFGATMSSKIGTWQGQFRQLDLTGRPLTGPERVAHVNAESYAGPIVWSGERYLTAYYDARQDDNYEIYLDVLNRQGQRLFDDVRVTTADDFSLNPALAWTGKEGLVSWEDRRFEGSGDSSAIFGQRVTVDGNLVGSNVRVSPAGVYAQSVSMALSDTGVGFSFISLEVGDQTQLRFVTTSRTLEQPSDSTVIPFRDADGPVVTAVGDKYVLTFHQFNGLSYGPAIFGVVLNKSGAIEIGPQAMTAGAVHARGNATYSYGDRFVMVWADDKDGPYQLYAQSYDQKLTPVSERLRLTTTMADALAPSVAASNDGGLGVLYTDESTGSRQTFFRRLDCASSDTLR